MPGKPKVLSAKELDGLICIAGALVVVSELLVELVEIVGVQELDQGKLTALLRLKYHNSIADAVADLGSAENIRKSFVGFQKYLYEEPVAA